MTITLAIVELGKWLEETLAVLNISRKELYKTAHMSSHTLDDILSGKRKEFATI